MKNFITPIVILALVSCASIPIPEQKPFLVSGIPISMNDTTWYRDYCTHGQPTNDKVTSYSSTGCVLLHSYMYKVKLRSPINLNRELFGGSISFVLTGGKRIDYNSSNSDEEFFILQNSPQYLIENTGIKYMGTQVSYDKKQNCIYHSGYIHTDYRNCPDRNFHETKKDECLSIEDIRNHYGE